MISRESRIAGPRGRTSNWGAHAAGTMGNHRSENQISRGRSLGGYGSIGTSETREEHSLVRSAKSLLPATWTGTTARTVKSETLKSSDGLTTVEHTPAHVPHLRGAGSGEGCCDSSPVSQSPQHGADSLAVGTDSFVGLCSQHVTSTPARQSAGGPTSDHIIVRVTVNRNIGLILLN
jgi:hypothetical protein